MKKMKMIMKMIMKMKMKMKMKMIMKMKIIIKMKKNNENLKQVKQRQIGDDGRWRW